MSQSMLSSVRTFGKVLMWTHFSKFLSQAMAFIKSLGLPLTDDEQQHINHDAEESNFLCRIADNEN